MNITGRLLNSNRLWALVILTFSVTPVGLHAQLLVDCSGNDPSAFPNINSALPYVTPGASIIVTGTCNESVWLNGMNGLNLGAWWGQTAAINGTVSINNSTLIYLYGLNVTSPSGDGVSVRGSRNVVLDTCTSNGNAGTGLNVDGMSEVAVNTTGAFDNNANGGIRIFGNSMVTLNAWGGLIDISNNIGPGVWSSQASLNTFGHTTIANNQLGPPQSAGWGMQLYGGSRFQVGALFGPNVIQGNPAGGAAISEESEISFWSAGPPNAIQGNGPVGISVNLGSQATFAGGSEITNHSDVGVDVYGHSQANLFGLNKVEGNGTPSSPRSAGIRVDGNSEAFLRGGDISQNNGPGLLALVNSSFDFTGVSSSGNSGGVVTCDSSSVMLSDLIGPNAAPAAGVHCASANALGNRQVSKAYSPVPDLSAYKALQAKYRKIATRH
jgi:hypothetical protein